MPVVREERAIDIGIDIGSFHQIFEFSISIFKQCLNRGQASGLVSRAEEAEHDSGV